MPFEDVHRPESWNLTEQIIMIWRQRCESMHRQQPQSFHAMMIKGAWAALSRSSVGATTMTSCGVVTTCPHPMSAEQWRVARSPWWRHHGVLSACMPATEKKVIGCSWNYIDTSAVVSCCSNALHILYILYAWIGDFFAALLCFLSSITDFRSHIFEACTGIFGSSFIRCLNLPIYS